MHEATLVKEPGTILDHTAAADINAGDFVVINDIVGVAPKPIASGAVGAVQTTGTYEAAKVSAESHGQGFNLYLNTTTRELTLNPTDNLWAGKCAKAAASGETTVQVALGGLCQRENVTS